MTWKARSPATKGDGTPRSRSPARDGLKRARATPPSADAELVAVSADRTRDTPQSHLPIVGYRIADRDHRPNRAEIQLARRSAFRGLAEGGAQVPAVAGRALREHQIRHNAARDANLAED